MKHIFCKKHFILLLWPVSILCLILAKCDISAAEHIFANTVSRAYLQLLGTLTGLLPFSLAEILILLLPPFIIFIIVKTVIKFIHTDKGNRLCFILRKVINLISICGIIFFMYVIGCGVNYYRYSFTYYSGYEVQPSPVSELQDMCFSLAERAVSLRSSLTLEDENHVFMTSSSDRELSGIADDAYDILSKKYDILSGFYPAPKRVLFSPFMSHLCITGVFIPFTGEANVNVAIPDYSVPSTMCHELAHLRGFMREDGANYLSYLACTASDNPEFQYSGVMLALIISGNALYSKSPDMYYEVCATYSDAILRDLHANNEYWDQFKDTVLSDTAEKVNDTYLKMNDQADGVQSYGRMVDLLLAEYRYSIE